MIKWPLLLSCIGAIFFFASPQAVAGSKDANDVSVHHEWGKLKEVVVGIGDGLIIPGYSKYVSFIYDPQYLDLMKKYGGKPASEVEPELSKRVIKQINNLADVLKKHGVKVHRPTRLNKAQSEFMEYVQPGQMQLYARDPMLVIGNTVFETALKVPMRAKERYGLRPILRDLWENRGANFISMPTPEPRFPEKGIYIEGGDVLLNGYEIYVGNTGRASTVEGIQWLQQQLGSKYRVIGVKMTPQWEHLDCAMALLRPGLGLIYKDAFKDPLPEAIRNWDFIEVTEDEARRLAANALVLDETTCIMDSQHQRIIKELRKRGHTVIDIPYDAVATWGGAFRCSHHPIIRESKLD